MSDYDFRTFNDKEFEILCTDLLGEVEGQRLERFKAGRDCGVDGRFFTDARNEVILQCKHWSNTPLKQLIKTLSIVEKPKLDKLKPHRYLLAVSNPLSRADKKSIHNALAPYVVSESDIYGKEDLNDLLRARPHIERRHYKLWLHSSSVLGHIFNSAILGRSSFSLEEIIRSSARYVVTVNHTRALGILKQHHVVIITGEPGVGKTTLADHLCLHYVSQGFTFLKIADDIKEAEAAFDPQSKQIVYFDDFLGRNYLDALKGHEGSNVTQFIRRVSTNKNKRFVLTSRSTILNQGKLLIDSLDHNNLPRNEYEIRIQSLTDLDKAQILYNHIWHSGLPQDYVEQLYIQRRYRRVIAHRNFNPRLISYVTDATRLESCPSDDYWEYILRSLTDPSQIWENPFTAQQDDFGRAIIFLVVLNGGATNEDVLAEAYYRYIALPENQNLRGRREFQTNTRTLTGSFLSRTVSATGPSKFDLFNPSIGDYVLRRYARDEIALRLGMISLRTKQSVVTLQSLARSKQLSKAKALSICSLLLRNLVENDFEGADIPYVSTLCQTYIDCEGHTQKDMAALRAAVLFIVSKYAGEATFDSYLTVKWAIEQQMIGLDRGLAIIASNIEILESGDEIRDISALLSAIPTATPGRAELMESIKQRVVEAIVDNFFEYIDIDDAFSSVEYGDVGAAEANLYRLVDEQLDYHGVAYNEDDVARIIRSGYRVDQLNDYVMNRYHDYGESEGPGVLAIDEIDDLFERSQI